MFSPREKEVLKVLGKRRMSIHDLCDKIYGIKKWPLGANNGIASAIRNINRKCEFHSLEWKLYGSGIGRAGRIVWKDKT